MLILKVFAQGIRWPLGLAAIMQGLLSGHSPLAGGALMSTLSGDLFRREPSELAINGLPEGGRSRVATWGRVATIDRMSRIDCGALIGVKSAATVHIPPTVGDSATRPFTRSRNPMPGLK
jgi:hypothetical protein